MIVTCRRKVMNHGLFCVIPFKTALGKKEKIGYRMGVGKCVKKSIGIPLSLGR